MSASPSPRRLAGASAPKTGHPYTGNVRPIPDGHLQRIFANGPLVWTERGPRHMVVKPTLADQLAETIRQPVTAYLLGAVSGASATVIAAMFWAGVLA